MGEVLRDSLPDRRRMRFGDIQYDLDHNVNTTWSNVDFWTRLRVALIGTDYQTTDPLVFAEAMEMVGRTLDPTLPLADGWGRQFQEFTFIDLGSGKGRVLLMALEYPFRRIVGVELLPELHVIAQENVNNLLRAGAEISGPQRIELTLGDARKFGFPKEPLVVFLFNPFPVFVLREVMANLEKSITDLPRDIFVVLHNPEHEGEIARVRGLMRVGGTYQFVLYRSQRDAG